MSEPRLVKPETSRRRRTDYIADAIARELDARRASLNADDAIRSVTVTVKMKQGTPFPRTVLVTIEAESEVAQS